MFGECLVFRLVQYGFEVFSDVVGVVGGLFVLFYCGVGVLLCEFVLVGLIVVIIIYFVIGLVWMLVSCLGVVVYLWE